MHTREKRISIDLSASETAKTAVDFYFGTAVSDWKDGPGRWVRDKFGVIPDSFYRLQSRRKTIRKLVHFKSAIK